MLNLTETARALVRGILEDAVREASTLDPNALHPEGWTLQGFGMLRRHLPGDWRLNVWNSAWRVRNVSLIHDHPWHFESLVVSGELRNVRYSCEPGLTGHDATHSWQELRPGAGGGLLGEPGSGREAGVGGLCKLVAQPGEVYRRGDVYRQRRDEVHLSDPSDGCVTFNLRTERLERDVARVFWPVGERWVSAEPRRATCVEVAAIVQHALARWEAR